MGTKKLQGADGMNFQLQLTIKGLESINLPEENLTNESGNDIMKKSLSLSETLIWCVRIEYLRSQL